MKKLLLATLLLIFSCDEVLDTLATDIISPIVVITFPANNSILDSTITVRANVTDDGEIKIVDFLIDGILVHTDTLSPFEYEWDVCSQIDSNPLNQDIPHTMLVKATDSAENIGQSALSTYTLTGTYDCAGVCGGDSLEDECLVCDSDSTNDGTMDNCGTCVGGITGLTACEQDCLGNYGGDFVLDECGACDNDSTNDCVQDCDDVWGGDAVLDECGVCDNYATNNNTPLTGTCDCAGTPSGTATTDNCGVCDTDSTNDCTADCAGVYGGTSWVSDCGCVSVTNSGNDCDDCAGTPNGTATTDNCGVCDTNSTNDCVQDCTGTWGGVEIDDDNDGICDNLQGTVTDIDDNTYKTIIIGTQTWLVENLKVSKYKNGTAISEHTSPYCERDCENMNNSECENSNYTEDCQWQMSMSGEAGCVQKNVCSNWIGDTQGKFFAWQDYLSVNPNYGYHYNWYAVDNSNGLCMDGWDVPSISDWDIMINYLGGESIAGGKMKDDNNWNGTNESGFTAMAVALLNNTQNPRLTNIPPYHENHFWTSDDHFYEEVSTANAFAKRLRTDSQQIISQGIPQKQGTSVRCLKDE